MRLLGLRRGQALGQSIPLTGPGDDVRTDLHDDASLL
jgi:hypothetical protein